MTCFVPSITTITGVFFMGRKCKVSPEENLVSFIKYHYLKQSNHTTGVK